MRKSNPNNTELKPEEVPYEEPKTAEDYLAFAEGLMGQGSTEPKAAVQAPVDDSKNKLTYEEQVNALVKEVTVDENGKFQYPADTPEHLKYAVATAKRYRDTQSGFTKTNQSLKEVEAENAALREQIAKATSIAATPEIPEAEMVRLDELMNTDPAAWRLEMNALEEKHKANVQSELNEQMSDVRTKVGAQHELDRRLEVLKTFNEGREVPVTSEVLDNDVPPRITKKLADGLLTFEGYLAEVDTYLSKNKVVANPTVDNPTKLSSGAGGFEAPSKQPDLEETALNYDAVIF